MPVYHVYILQSNKDRHYIGYTSNLSQRISQHNRKHKGFTNVKNEIWNLLVSMEFTDKNSAMNMEKKLKAFNDSQKAITYIRIKIVQSIPTKSGGS